VRVDETGQVVDEARRETPPAADLVDVLCELVEQVAGGDDSGASFTVGVGLPGLITPGGVVRASPNLRGARDTPVGPGLRDRLAVPVHVENDATMAAFGEWRAGAARGARDAVMVTLGTGIGGGLVMGGVLQRGAHGFAGEIGHMIVDRDGIECPCGKRGCWERYASGTSLGHSAGAASGEDVIAAARAGDTSARAHVEEFAGWVALGLANLTNLCDPEVIVLGGGVMEAHDVLFDAVRTRFAEALYSPAFRAHPRLEVAHLGHRAGAIGAALMAADLG
jgi:glucokinase